MNITINPLLTGSAPGTFRKSSEGLIQGWSYDDPVTRNFLNIGVVKSDQTYPMWGGIGISERIPVEPSRLGGNIIRATGLTGASALTGFSVFDQNFAAINSPQSPVPLMPQGGACTFYRLGSGARIAVKCDPTLVSLEGAIINPAVSWDFVNQILVPEIGTLTISSGTYNSTTGVIVLTLSASAGFGPGPAATISSLTGTGAYASLNGTYTVTAVSGVTVTLAGTAGAGAATITGGSLVLGSGASSALDVSVLEFDIGNSMTVSYDTSTGYATWVRSGNCAIIKI